MSKKKKEKRRMEAFYEQCRAHSKLWELHQLDLQRRSIVKKIPRYVSEEASFARFKLEQLATRANLEHREKARPIARRALPRDTVASTTTELLHNKLNQRSFK
jgi:hypothetical protein